VGLCCLAQRRRGDLQPTKRVSGRDGGICEDGCEPGKICVWGGGWAVGSKEAGGEEASGGYREEDGKGEKKGENSV